VDFRGKYGTFDTVCKNELISYAASNMDNNSRGIQVKAHIKKQFNTTQVMEILPHMQKPA